MGVATTTYYVMQFQTQKLYVLLKTQKMVSLTDQLPQKDVNENQTA